ncbi:class I adenylate-forming enzyme family protein [Bacillus sp. REN16]|uniref:class I adenylate-forming enzyme family protein n=1 Tax=Bacillus sp. REN16 TaxID=2887296 RepID=UPI001E60B1A7|nr:class I adenylate-forming enzyme family protein [Bacillus sp. REN16]MCC3357942.1 acyl--CoA ligase [Bacillus sp. REN16]
MDLNQIFNFAVERFPNKIAVVDGERKYTYRQLGKEVNSVASSFHKIGIKKKDRIALLLKNRLESIVIFWAIQKLGAIFAPINSRQSQEVVHYCLNDLEAKLIIYEQSTEILINKTKFKERPLLLNIDGKGDINYSELTRLSSNDFNPNEINSDDLAVILYTSGTTGRPKGVPRSHQNEYSSSYAHIFQCHYQLHDTTLGVMPLYHTMGLRSLISMVMLNGTYIIQREFDAYDAVTLIETEKITCLYLFPNMYYDIAMLTDITSSYFNEIRTIAYAGAPMSKRVVQLCQDIFQPSYFVNHYGSTEVYTFTYCDNIDKKPGCAGKPGIHQNIRIIEPDIKRTKTPEDIVEEGKVGEIIVNLQSPEAFKGYWNKPDLTKRSVVQSWYYTGDLGYIDSDGDMYVVGRIDEMILCAGDNIYPLEVENVLMEHPKVDKAVVVGECDERWGQIVVAIIVPSDDTLSVGELDLFCKNHPILSNYKRPRRYIFESTLPKKYLRTKTFV